MDTHLDGRRAVLPDDPRGKRRRMGRLLPGRIIPSVSLGLAAVLDAHGEHAHHAPLRVKSRGSHARLSGPVRETRQSTLFFHLVGGSELSSGFV
jgi:hypothetical protein